MKPWAEMTAGGRFGVVGGVVAVVAALFWGAWSVRGVPPAEVTATGSGETAPAVEPAAEPAVAAEGASTEAAEAEQTAAPEAVAQEAEPAVPAGNTQTAAAADGAVTEAAPEGTEAAAEAAPEAAVSGEAAPEPGAEAGEAVVSAGEGAADPAAVLATEPAAGDTAEVAAPAASAVVPPSFDLVRVERDGAALVAGKAAPSSMLSLRVTGAEIALVPADGQGNFVAMFNLAPSNAPRVLSLVMQLADGTEVSAEGSVVIAPTVAPAVATAAAPAEATAEEGTAAEAAAAEPAPAAEAPAALLVTDAGAKVLQTADALPAELVSNVTIDTITYTPEGAVQLAGRGTAERAVRIYLDNAQIADAAISAGGDWAVTLPDVAAGIYTLRADQLDGEGKVTSRFETPFKRETVEALAAASGAELAATAEVAATSEAETVAVDTVAVEPAGPVTVTVQPGFTLWRIATENLGEGILYVQVFEANKDQIRDPDLIYPGQVFTIPKEE